MKVYLSGPMTGIPDYNFPAFEAAAKELRARDQEVFSPHELGVDPAKTWADYLRADIRALVDCDAVVCLPGWEQSKGASLEVYIAKALEMPVLMVGDVTLPPISSGRGGRG